MPKFEKGDVVVFKSGGLPMTIDGFTRDGNVICVWVDKNNEKKDGVFRKEAIKKVEEDGGFIPDVL